MTASFPAAWLDPERTDRLHATMLEPNTRAVLGTLDLEAGGSLTQGYRTDTRVSASVTMADWRQWRRNAMVRLDHTWRCGEANGFSTGAEVLGTFFAEPGDRDGDMGGTSCGLSLTSQLWGYASDDCQGAWTVAAGASARSVLSAMAGYDRPSPKYRFMPDFHDYRHGSTVSYDQTNMLSMMMQECGNSGNRADVTLDGYASFGAYRVPSRRDAAWSLSWDSPLVVSGSVSVSDDAAKTADRSIVAWTVSDGGESVDVTGTADLPRSNPLSVAQRGFRVTARHSLTGMDSTSSWEATQRAKSWLPEDSTTTVTHSVTVTWCPINAGDVVMWTPRDGATERDGARKCLVASADCDLGAWTKSLKLEEV